MPRVSCPPGFLVVLSVLAGTLGAALLAQTPQTPVFRAGVNLVSVDVYPRRNGEVVEGLTANDFQVFENGNLQKVETFEFVKSEPNPVDVERRDPSSQSEGDQLARDPRTRVFVVYLDTAHLTFSGAYGAHRPVVDFLTRTIGATDLFGVMTAYTPTSSLVFGRRTETIEGELAKYSTVAQADINREVARTPIEDRLMNCTLAAIGGGDQLGTVLRTYREDLLMSSLETLMVRLRDLRDERKNLLFVSEGWVPQRPNPVISNLTTNLGRVAPVGVGPGGRIGIGQSQDPNASSVQGSWCDQMFARLGGLDFEKRFRDLLTDAQRANVSFYPVDVAGLRVSSPLGGPMSTLQTLAENTDGLAIVNTNDIQAGVRRISTNLSAFYLLRYYSANSNMDGRYREIEVKITRPGVQVRARPGYLALTPAALARPSAPPTPEGIDAAFARLAPFRDGVEVSAYATSSATGLDVVTEIAATAFGQAAWQRGAAVRVSASKAGADPIVVTGSIAAGERSARFSVPVPNAAAVGAWRVVVDVSGPDGPVQAQADVAARTSRLLGDATLWRGATSPRVPLKPMADFRLSRIERLRVQWPLVGAVEGQTARLVDRRGQPRGALPVTAVPGDDRLVAVDLPLSALPEGEYAIELTVTGGGGEERQVVAFRVVR